jgi:hypothetical protein
MLHEAFTAFASEFPNDNADLHLGTIWMCEEVCGPAEAHFPEEPEEPAGLEAREEIEIVDALEELEELGAPIEIVPAPLESGVVAFLSECEREAEGAGDEGYERDEERAEASEEVRPAPLVSTVPPPIRDPFEAFLQTLSDVACDAGHMFAASEIGAALDGDPVACAWRAILNGESEDFSLCGTPLDEWASVVLARVIAAPHKAGQLRRELRAHGVAAFGLIEAA